TGTACIATPGSSSSAGTLRRQSRRFARSARPETDRRCSSSARRSRGCPRGRRGCSAGQPRICSGPAAENVLAPEPGSILRKAPIRRYAFTHVSVRLRCRSVKISLTPKTTEFFVLFTKAGENALEVAQLVERRFREHPNSTVTQEQVKAAETAGDTITRELVTLLNTQYLTPYDRDDIYMLATEIDPVGASPA